MRDFSDLTDIESGSKEKLDKVRLMQEFEKFLEDFPYLEAEDIDACLKYAAAKADHPVLLAQ